MVARVAGEGRFFAQKHPQYRAGSAAANEVGHRPAFVVADGQEKPIDRRKEHPIGDRNAHGLLVRGGCRRAPGDGAAGGCAGVTRAEPWVLPRAHRMGAFQRLHRNPEGKSA